MTGKLPIKFNRKNGFRGLLARIQFRLLWLRYCYSFVWAHKPLCSRFRSGVYRIGPLYLCKGCTNLYLGLVCVPIFVMLTGYELRSGEQYLYFFILCLVVILSREGWYKKLPALLRGVVRFCTGVLLSVSVLMLFSSLWWAGAIGLLVLMITYRLYMTRRKIRKAETCEGCAELASGRVCSGFEFQAEKLRELELVLTKNLEKETGAW